MKTIDPQNEYDQEYFEFDLFMGRREYKMITRRMQRGRHIAAQEGYYVGSIAPYSYSRIKLDKGYSLEIYEEENIVFNIMKKKALEDEGSTNISNHLNDLGYKPRKGEYWTKSADVYKRQIYDHQLKLHFLKELLKYLHQSFVLLHIQFLVLLDNLPMDHRCV